MASSSETDQNEWNENQRVSVMVEELFAEQVETLSLRIVSCQSKRTLQWNNREFELDRYGPDDV